MSEKLTNAEILQQIGEMSKEEANQYGITGDMQDVALKAAGGDRTATASFYAQYTPLYNAFCGFVVKFALSALSKASFDDVYAAHHRSMTQGRPQLGFVKLAKAGTGNSSAQFADNPAIGSLTTVVTADMPDMVALYDITANSYVARIPVSFEDVKTAFTTEYGINELYLKVRESLNDKIVEDRNSTYDTALQGVFDSHIIPAGTGSESSSYQGAAVYEVVKGSADWATAVSTGDLSGIDDDALTQVFVSIKNAFFGITGRPSTKYNALGVLNNKKDNLVCYIWAPLYAELSRVKASAFNLDELVERGLRWQPLIAPWLGRSKGSGTSALYSLAAIGSADFIRDWPTSDFASTVPTDRGVIECRFMDTQLAVCGYEPFIFLCGGYSVNAPTAAFNFKAATSANTTYPEGFSSATNIERHVMINYIASTTGNRYTADLRQDRTGYINPYVGITTVTNGFVAATAYDLTFEWTVGGTTYTNVIRATAAASGSEYYYGPIVPDGSPVTNGTEITLKKVETVT